MKKITVLILFSAALFITGNSWAELRLPSAQDRQPNTSLDPFERARDAVRGLPRREQSPPPPPPKPPPSPRREQVEEFAPGIPAIIEPPREQAPISPEAIPAISSTQEPAQAYTQEFVGVVDWFALASGGVAPAEATPEEEAQASGTSAMLGLLNYSLTVDTAAAELWRDGTLFLGAGFTFGNSPSDFAGDFHGVSSIDTGGSIMKILQAWYEHHFDHAHTDVLAGVHDFNNEFDVLEYAGLFVNGSPGLGGLIGGVAPAPTFPSSRLGLRIKTELTPEIYMLLGAYDGAANENPNAFIDITPNAGEGVFAISEVGYVKGEPGASGGYLKAAVGGWYLKQLQERMLGLEEGDGYYSWEDPDTLLQSETYPGLRAGVGGWYAVAESSIGDKLGVFGKVGMMDPNFSRFSAFYLAGINYTGLIPGRDDDILGIAFMQTRQSDRFLYMNPKEDPADDDIFTFFPAENVIELTYTTQLTDWLMIQPDLQYIQAPSMSPYVPNTIVLGIRAQATY